ncbi:MAG: heat shock protein Hsp20 family protein [Chloroflexi bacterium OLB15]|nr:MAG: heat shock protein Hsp20 family protein [Chloroflexi bacterium OLB15]
MENNRVPAERDRRVIQRYMVWWSNRTFVPPTDVLELPDKIVVMVEVAGMRASEINVSLIGRELTISGARERPSLPATAYHQVEIGYGEFQVDVQLPQPVSRESVSASYRDGLLVVELSKVSDGQHVVIPVNSEDNEAR